MKTAILCIVFLALASVCFSTPVFLCRCPRANKRVQKSLIASFEIINPRPYCKQQEIIAKLTDGRPVCLDPEGETARRLIKDMQKKANAARSTTTASAIVVTTTS